MGLQISFSFTQHGPLSVWLTSPKGVSLSSSSHFVGVAGIIINSLTVIFFKAEVDGSLLQLIAFSTADLVA